MDTIRLRTLARKSIMGFGRFHDYRVHDLINLGHKRFLRWYYYNMSMISFNDEILDVIGITEEHRITKPGKNPNRHDELNKEIDPNWQGLSKHKTKLNGKAASRGRQTAQRHRERIYYSKGSMQARNHGR